MSENIQEQEQNEELFEHHRIEADPGQQPLRIDKFLHDRIANSTRNKIQTAAKNGNILVNDKAVKANYKVKANDVISVVMPYPVREIELIAENLPINIAYEDDEMVMVNKTPNMVVHPGYGNYKGTLVNAMLYHFENLPGATKAECPRPGLVHRLDKDTSGIMVLAKSEDALSHLSKQFFDRTINRRYQAIVWGDLKEEEGEIEGYIGRSHKDRKVMGVFDNEEQGKYALTRYKVLERFGYVTLVECKLETGRTHQIRAHFKHIGHPLFNDSTYGGDRVVKGTTFSKYKQFIANCFEICPRQALHAKLLEVDHPKTGKRISVDSELPEDMQNLMAKFRSYVN